MPCTRSINNARANPGRGPQGSRRHFHQSNHTSIRSFVKTTKPITDEGEAYIGKTNELDATSCSRKRSHELQIGSSEEPSQNKRLKASAQRSSTTPLSSKCATRHHIHSPLTPERTPSSCRFSTANLAPVIPTDSATSLAYSTPPATPSKGQPHDAIELPEELESLKQLNASFLKALSLHVAHNAAGSPIAISNLAPSVSKIWRKRKVSLEDVRRSLGILKSFNDTCSDMGIDIAIYDYGHGLLCLEVDAQSSAPEACLRPINEQKLNRLFDENLRRLWNDFIQNIDVASAPHDPFVSEFQKTIPLMPILQHSSEATDANPISLKPSTKRSSNTSVGQRRLTELFPVSKNLSTATQGSSKPQAARPNTQDKVNSQKSTVQSRATLLADRLMQKSKEKAALVQPSAADISRNAALQRIPEIVAILSADAFRSTQSNQGIQRSEQELQDTVDSGKTQRKTYNLTSLILKIQESARGILAHDEIQQCLEILSNEGLAGEGFVKIVSIGSSGDGTVVGVVVDVSKRIELAKITHRVQQPIMMAS